MCKSVINKPLSIGISNIKPMSTLCEAYMGYSLPLRHALQWYGHHHPNLSA